MTNSRYVLMATTQQSNTELVLLLEGIQLVGSSSANTSLSNQWYGGAGTDLI
jgi:hypothetical protein